MLFSSDQRDRIAKQWQQALDAHARCGNVWQEAWNVPYNEFGQAFTNATSEDTPEAWNEAVLKGIHLRELMRTGDGEETVFYMRLVSVTDAITLSLEIAGGNTKNYIPSARNDLLIRIIRLERQVDEERRRVNLSQALENQLEQAKRDIRKSKSKLELNIIKIQLDADSIAAIIRDSLEALKHGIDLLYDSRFTEPLRKQALATWLGGRRFVRAVRRRFITFKLPWRDHSIFNIFERTEPSLPAKSDLEKYLNERTINEIDASVTALSLYDNYCEWCESTGHEIVGLPIFSRQLTELGITKAKLDGKIRYVGIGLIGESVYIPSDKGIEIYIGEQIEKNAEASVTALALYDNYCEWCERNQRQPLGLPIFSKKLTALGIQKRKIGDKIRYTGIRLLNESTAVVP
jgi:hypothetical protein